MSSPAASTEAHHPRGADRSPTVRFVEWFVIIVLAVLVSFLIRQFVFETFSIPSRSMMPTLFVGDRIIIDKLSVELGSIHVGDVVVFKAPPTVASLCQDPVTDLVKRVIGVPGDHLTSRGNTIFVNGVALKEDWSHWEPLGPPIGKVTVTKNHYFMMGDNHNNSCDSRTWGLVPRSDILGKAFVRVWPIGRLAWL